MGIDGVVLDVLNTEANDVAFGRPSAGERGDGAFPQIFISYKLWKELTSRDLKLLARVTSRLILKPIRNLADGT
jgi:hypothetical protein